MQELVLEPLVSSSKERQRLLGYQQCLKDEQSHDLRCKSTA